MANKTELNLTRQNYIDEIKKLLQKPELLIVQEEKKEEGKDTRKGKK